MEYDIVGQTTNFTMEIAHQVEETQEDFIFTVVYKYFGQDDEISKMPISKEILRRAILCFAEEHHDEYYQLLNESNRRMQEKETKT